MDRFSRSFPNLPPRVKSRFGCLTQIVLALALSLVVSVLVTGIVGPWGFFLGGNFHILPDWHGWGTLQAKSGNYLLYVRFQPRPSGSHIYPGPSVGGRGYLCTPRGEILYMHLGGGMRRGIGLNTDGEKISFYMNNYSGFWSSYGGDHRPSIELRGEWHNPNIVMDDHGSIARGFNPDGTISTDHDANRAYLGEVIPITLAPGSYSDFEAACKANQK
jgi:hypothetical protein